MDAFEYEYRRVEPTLQKWVSFFLFRKEIDVRRPQNWIKDGPNIIIGNHCGAFKDVATIFRVVPRMIFFTANKDIFSQGDFNRLMLKHLKRHLKDFGPVLYMMTKPLRTALIRFVTTHINKVGTIPVDLEGGKREAMGLCQEYLAKGRAIVALQGRGRIQPRNAHPYISPFKRGTAILAYNLLREQGISVPVTPLAMHGTQAPWIVPGRIGVNIGAPMFIADYLSAGFAESIENFRNALETRVKALFLELIRT
jgi:1-acyl-sn-glycerol-3-phosphate acyltransferase